MIHAKTNVNMRSRPQSKKNNYVHKNKNTRDASLR